MSTHACPPTFPFACPPVCQPVCSYACLSTQACLSVDLPFNLAHACPCKRRQSVSLFYHSHFLACLSLSVSICLTNYLLPACQHMFVHLPVRLPVRLSVHTYLSVCVFNPSAFTPARLCLLVVSPFCLVFACPYVCCQHVPVHLVRVRCI